VFQQQLASTSHPPPLAKVQPSIQHPHPHPTPKQTIVAPLQNLGGEFERLFNLAGDAVVAMSTNIATAMKSAQNQLDEMTPGPNMQQVIVQLR
jgi:hypothetical protein